VIAVAIRVRAFLCGERGGELEAFLQIGGLIGVDENRSV
jgi:hypothetical protein